MSELRTNIVKVTVYPDCARVTRQGLITLEAGLNKLQIAELPLSLDPASVRASGLFRASAGSGNARLLGVDVRKVFYQETPTAQVQALEKQIQDLEDQDQALADQANALKTQGDLARSVADKAGEQLARGVAFARADIGQGDALVKFVAQELARTQSGLREAGLRRRELGKQLAQLRQQLNVLQGSRARERYSATVEVEMTAPGELTVELNYLVSGAKWEPLYDLRLHDAGLELTYLSQVTQHTGEDWLAVALVLSTARPSQASALPEFQPWYLSAYQPRQERTRSAKFAREMPEAPPPQAAAPASLDADMFQASIPVEMEAVTAQVQDTGASVTFHLPQRADVPADGEPHKVTVAVTRLEPRLDYVTAPKLAEVAFRRAKIKNATNLLLLPGKAALFVEGDYIGGTLLKRAAPGEEFELYLGVEERVSIKRELKAREVDKKFLQDKRQLHYGYETELRNLRPDKIALEVRDQLPVARHESVKVKLDSADPKPSETSELGELVWKFALDPGGSRFIRFDFSIEHPRDMTVAGLP